MDRELIFSLTKKDFRVDTFKVSGPGGQNKDKSDTGVRITHIESDSYGSATDTRSQLENKKIAFIRMYNSKRFQDWLRAKLGTKVDIEITSEEVIRTYNFTRNEVKDHRTGQKYNIKKFMDGDYETFNANTE